MQPIDVRNPRTGEVDYQLQAPPPDALARRCEELRVAQAEWSALPAAERIGVMLRWAESIDRHADKISKALAVDTGRWRMSVESPQNVANGIRGWCEMAGALLEPASGQSQLMPDASFVTYPRPYPLLAVISPWNVPFLLATIDATPALMAGCAAIIKPSEVTPRFIEPVQESIDSVPELARVLQFVGGAAETGQQMIAEADVVVFTGSVATGQRILRAASERFIPSFLELGGKDAAIITECADLERAAQAVLRGAVMASGQLCYSIERVYVQAAVHEEFVKRLVAAAQALDINYPDIHQGHIGPLIFAQQADVIADHIADARAKGARVLTGGEIEQHGGGLWVRATVVTGVDHSMRVMTDETFGPVVPVMPYNDDEQAIALANDTQFGLSAAVLAGSEARAAEIGRRLNAGAVSLMDTALTGAILRDAEKTSFGCSGLGGSRMGAASIARFFRKQTLITNHGEVQSMEDLGEAQAPQVAY
jgi:acyl-CoA reductase-like NAD-dependent aldehyde dehydrogenase